MILLEKIARYTLDRGAQGDVRGRASKHTVAEYQVITSPRMRVRHFNIAGVAWSNFKPGININGRKRGEEEAAATAAGALRFGLRHACSIRLFILFAAHAAENMQVE
jgi:hypothetical protein